MITEIEKSIIKSEGNFHFFMGHGYPCIVVRPWMLDKTLDAPLQDDDKVHLCGYVGISKTHPLFGKDTDNKEIEDLCAHGGVTFADTFAEDDTIPALRQELSFAFPDYEKFWFIGFDCAHAGDASIVEEFNKNTRYTNMAYVKFQVKDLAKQLKEKEDTEIEKTAVVPKYHTCGTYHVGHEHLLEDMVGCYFQRGDERGFHFFDEKVLFLLDGDEFVYNKGRLFRKKRD